MRSSCVFGIEIGREKAEYKKIKRWIVEDEKRRSKKMKRK